MVIYSCNPLLTRGWSLAETSWIWWGGWNPKWLGISLWGRSENLNSTATSLFGGSGYFFGTETSFGKIVSGTISGGETFLAPTYYSIFRPSGGMLAGSLSGGGVGIRITFLCTPKITKLIYPFWCILWCIGQLILSCTVLNLGVICIRL